MKNIKNIILPFCLGSLVLASCSDFEEVNVDPTKASGDQMKVEYMINESLTKAQQDPDVAERAFVLNWKTAARQQWATGISTGSYNDSWISNYYDQSANWQTSINLAITLADEKIEKGLIGDDAQKIPNYKQVARIWRVYLMSEFVDNFGALPMNGFTGMNPTYSNAKDVYYFMLSELKDAVAQIDPSVTVTDDEKKYDRAYGFDFSKWIKYANSMRLRLAMRMSEVDPQKAQSEFEDAVKGSLIQSADDNFTCAERPGWDALTGVMTREWNDQLLSSTLNNLMINIGGIKSADQSISEAAKAHIKPANYMGQRYEKHFSLYTNDPSAGFWYDGLYEKIDPRAYALFFIPGDFDNKDYCYFPSWTQDAKTQIKNLYQDDKATVLEKVDASYTWNAPAVGSYGDKGAKNELYAYSGTCPGLVLKYRNSQSSRIFLASWETYFLIAEAALRGWNVPMSAKQAYENGVRASFEYNGVSQFVDEYLASTEYNRVGTSANWDHTAEPPATVQMTMKDGYTKADGTYTFKYPAVSNTLYGKALNDHLTKVITQKYLANMPWLPLEAWSDHRRLGLPFFETPCVEQPLVYIPSLTKENYMKAKTEYFPQRLKFPSKMETNNPTAYSQIESILGGPDNVFTPIWWAKH